MKEQIYFDDVPVGEEVISYVYGPVTLKQFVMWAGAIDDYSEIHYDTEFAIKFGLKGPVMHGPMKSALLARLLTDWISPLGQLRKLRCEYRAADLPGVVLTFKACTVNKRTTETGENQIDLEVWAGNDEGIRSVQGTATVTLPSRQ